jgi:DNA-directed RNA polymerase specialized sigma24 family protein
MSGDGHDLDQLLDAARAGGGWAFERLWQELSPVVLGYLRGRRTPDPEDVTSEVFLAAFQQVGAFRELNLAETASVVGKPVGAVKALQRRALDRLRRDLQSPPVSSDRSPAIAWLR